MLNFVSVIGAIIAGVLSDRFGRTKTMFITALLFLIGGIVLILSQNFTMIIIGRIITGLSVGVGLAVDPLYISEISPKEIRGGLVTASEFAINFGILLGFLCNYIFGFITNDSISWRLMLVMGVILPIVMIFLSLCVMKESPRFLMKSGKES